MQPSGRVLIDNDGYEWQGLMLRAKNHAAYDAWARKYGTPDDWALMTLDRVTGGNLPDCFSVYDPFQKEPALFEIAARLLDNFNADEILKFANKWGMIDPQYTAMLHWQFKLEQLGKIARAVGKAGVQRNQKTVAANITVICDDAKIRYEVLATASGLQSKIVVVGLIGCLLVQASEAVANELVIRNCEYCGRPIADIAVREDRRFCSDSCRIQKHKQRRREAIALHEKGKTAKQIAAAVDTELKTVRRWLKPKGK